MADAKEKLLEANELFQQEDYIESNSVCCELISTILKDPEATPEMHKDLFILSAKNALFLSDLFNIKDSRQVIAQSVGYATVWAKTIEEYFEILNEINEAINDWERICTIDNLNKIISNPSCTNVKKYYLDTTLEVLFLKSIIEMTLNPDNLEHLKELFDSTGLEHDEIKEKYSIPEKNEFTSSEKYNLVYEAGCTIFNNTVNLIESEKRSSSEYLEAICGKMIDGLFASQFMVDYCIDDDNDNPDKLKYCHKNAEILNYMISVITYPNGNPVKLIDDDEEQRKELIETYNKIKALDDSFEIPVVQMPMKNHSVGQSSIPTVSASKSTSGCYVATAVYGSYDCPEVWTLRRYRDNILAKTVFGRAFIKTYYAISPTLVKWFGNTEWFKNMWRGRLDRIVAELQKNGVEDTPYEDSNR